MLPPQYWCYPPHVLVLFPTALNNLHSINTVCLLPAVLKLCLPPAVLKLSPTVLSNLRSTEAILHAISTMYWTTSNVLNNLHSTEPTLYGVYLAQSYNELCIFHCIWSWLWNDDIIVTSNQDSRCRIMRKIIHPQHNYNRAKLKISTASVKITQWQ